MKITIENLLSQIEDDENAYTKVTKKTLIIVKSDKNGYVRKMEIPIDQITDENVDKISQSLKENLNIVIKNIF